LLQIGIGPTLLTVPLFWSIYFNSYESLKRRWNENFSPHYVHLFSAISAGAVADIVTNPFWVVRTRIQLNVLHLTRGGEVSSMTTMQMFLEIYRKEGFRAFYKGTFCILLEK